MLLQDLPLSKGSEPGFTACLFRRSGDRHDLLGRYRGYRIFVILALMAGLVLLCYRTSFYRALTVMEISYLFITSLPESIGLAVMNLIYHGDVMTQADGTNILKWQIYIVIILIRLALTAVASRLFQNFQYQIYARDAAILSACFLLVFGVSFASTYNYLNLGEGNTLLLDLITALLSVFFMAQFLYSKNVLYLREQEQRDKTQIAQLQQQYAYYQDKQRDEERIRAIYHDMKNHLLVLEGSQGTDATRQMAQELRTQIADYENYVHTGNEFLDIILKDKAEKARAKEIDFSAAIDFEGVDFIDPLDISTLFGNGIDNAIEASEKLRAEDRVILAKAGRIQDFVSILIENNCTEEAPVKGKRTTKADPLLHGFGIANMKKAAGKYGGTCTTNQADGTFTLKILLPVPNAG